MITILGTRFGRWLVIGEAPRDAGNRQRWLCQCSCGTIKTVDSWTLRKAKSTSCGCYAREQTAQRSTTHGDSKSKLFGVWWSMHQRCKDSKNNRYTAYGGRGIMVCKEWNEFATFKQDMSISYRPGLMLERKDVNGNYSPGNCVWATRKEQARNMRRNILISTPWGKKCIAEAAELSGLPYSTIYSRVRAGWSAKRYFEPPRRWPA